MASNSMMIPKPDQWARIFDVTDVQKHPKGYTIYKVTSTVSFNDSFMFCFIWLVIIEIIEIYNDFSLMNFLVLNFQYLDMNKFLFLMI